MSIANVDREILLIFWTTWEISMKFSEKMWLRIILKVAKNQGFALSLEDTFFEKSQIDPPGVLGLILSFTYWFLVEKNLQNEALIVQKCILDLLTWDQHEPGGIFILR